MTVECAHQDADEPSSSGDGELADLLRALARPSEAEDRFAASEEPDRSGRQLGQFRLLERLGVGGMGVVYRAQHSTLRRQVALKLLRADAAVSPARRLRFLREARAASTINHPNVAAVFEVGDVDGVAFIAMELVDGQRLRDLLNAGRLPLVDVRRIARSVAEALGRAHALGIVHRDLKPENVMLSSTGVVKVLDFGLARQLPNASAPGSDGSQTLEPDLTGAHGMLGTPGYMSPEQVLGQEIGPRSDVFVFGLLLFELLTGRRPFDGATRMETAVSICRDATPELGRGLPRGLVRLVERCLRKEPGERLADCAAVVAVLDAEKSPRKRLLLGALAAGATLLGVLVFLRTLAPTPSVPAASPEPLQRSVAAGSPAPARATSQAEPKPEPKPSAQRPSVSAARASDSARVPGKSATSRPASEQDLLHYRE